MKAVVIIEKDENGYGAFIENVKSTIIGEGKSVSEAKADLLHSYEEVKASYLERGEPVPAELRDLTFEYKYDVSALFNAFDFLNVSKFAEKIGISPSLMRHYKSGDTYISAAQAKKIETGLHQVAQEFLRVSL